MISTLFKRYKAIAYLPTTYAVLQYMLLRPCGVEDTLFFIDKSCQKDLIMQLPNHLYIDRQIGRPDRLQTYGRLFLLNMLARRTTTIYLSSEPVYVNLCTYYFDHVVYLEDGYSIYLPGKPLAHTLHPATLRQRWNRSLFGTSYPTRGRADKVEKIYLTGIMAIPDDIAAKAELFDLKELWARRSPSERQQIVRLFLPEGIESLACMKVDTLLLTQPVSEDMGEGFSEEEKIDIYREALAGIDEQTVLIKPHPREQTDYGKYFPRARVLTTLCPMELLEILGMRVRRAITINSTAIYNMDKSVEKVIAANNPSSKVKDMIERLSLRGIHL